MNVMNTLLQSLIANNPNMANNPNAQNYLNVIQSNDQAKGEQIANNLCQTMGMSREQAIAQAKAFFGLR